VGGLAAVGSWRPPALNMQVRSEIAEPSISEGIEQPQDHNCFQSRPTHLPFGQVICKCLADTRFGEDAVFHRLHT
jgi:hypothetical protein